MSKHIFSTYRLVRLSLLSLLLCIAMSSVQHLLVYAEIYTYEQNGVIIISSEPPPQPKRRHSRRKKRPKKAQTSDWQFGELRLQQNKKTRQLKKLRQKQQKQATKKKRRKAKANKKISATKLPTPRILRRLKSPLQILSQKYKLPDDLLRSVFKSCHFVNPQIPSSVKAISKSKTNPYLRLTCVSLEVAELMDKRNLMLEVDQKHRYLEYASWLLRKLINDYRGDLTLALSAYFISAQNKNDFESVLAKDLSKKETRMTLSSLVKASQTSSRQSLARQTTVDSSEKRQQATAFFKYILTEL